MDEKIKRRIGDVLTFIMAIWIIPYTGVRILYRLTGNLDIAVMVWAIGLIFFIVYLSYHYRPRGSEDMSKPHSSASLPRVRSHYIRDGM